MLQRIQMLHQFLDLIHKNTKFNILRKRFRL